MQITKHIKALVMLAILVVSACQMISEVTASVSKWTSNHSVQEPYTGYCDVHPDDRELCNK